jgi:hypothetical protein
MPAQSTPWSVLLLLLLLVRSSCAWSLNGGEDKTKAGTSLKQVRDAIAQPDSAPAVWRRVGEEITHVLDEMVEDSVAKRGPVSPPATTAPAKLPACHWTHDLSKRQDNGQVQQLSDSIQQISQASRQVSQASQQLSQSSQQLSQSLQQATISLTQLRSSASQFSQASQSASQAAQQAQQSAQQASDAADRASSSASSAISAAQASAASSASIAIAANLASVTSSAAASASVIMAAASSSAAGVMASANSMIESVQAQATAARVSTFPSAVSILRLTCSQDQANTDVTQAQGTAVSVTQAAVAIVAAIVGSSLLTILAFWLVLRRKRERDRRSRALLRASMPGGSPMQDANGFFAREKEVQRPPSNGSSAYDMPVPRTTSLPMPATAPKATTPTAATRTAPAPAPAMGRAPALLLGMKADIAPRTTSTMTPPLRRQVATDAPMRNPVILQPVPTIRPGAARVARLSTVESGPSSGNSADARKSSAGTPGGLGEWLRQGKESPFNTLVKRDFQGAAGSDKKVSWPQMPGTMPRRSEGGPS